MEGLDEMLKRAARADGWTKVVHRCAWCRRRINAPGSEAELTSLEPTVVVTDGMCPTCGSKALAAIAHRRAAA